MSDTATPVAAVETPAAQATPAAAPATPSQTPVAATQQPSAVQTATPSASPQASATQAQGPEGWVPSYRLREANERYQREAQQQVQQAQQQYQQQIHQLQSQLQALVGAQPPQNQEVTAVRSQFGQLYPGLSQLEEKAADLLGLIDRAGDLQSQTDHYWQNYGRQSMDRLYGLAEKALGAPLNDEGKRALHNAFTGFVGSSEELTARYAQDPSLADEWFNSFSQAFISPAQRQASATVQGRAQQVQGLPNVAGGAIPQVSQPPKPKDMDERASQAWAQFQQQRG